VIVLDPTGRVDVVNVATPPLSVAVPNVVAPFLSVTVPVGTPPEEVTVAVKVTACPEGEGFGEELSDSAVRALVTTCFSTVEVLALYAPSPL
jgi:hypothetical protein